MKLSYISLWLLINYLISSWSKTTLGTQRGNRLGSNHLEALSGLCFSATLNLPHLIQWLLSLSWRTKLRWLLSPADSLIQQWNIGKIDVFPMPSRASLNSWLKPATWNPGRHQLLNLEPAFDVKGGDGFGRGHRQRSPFPTQILEAVPVAAMENLQMMRKCVENMF